MTTSSGSAGSTRKTLATSDRPSSATPPRNPAEVPTRTESSVAMTPVSSPSTTVERVPTSSWERTSWPVAVVPSRWLEVGPSGSAWPVVVADGSNGATQGPTIATRMKRPRITAPILALSGRLRQHVAAPAQDRLGDLDDDAVGVGPER